MSVRVLMRDGNQIDFKSKSDFASYFRVQPSTVEAWLLQKCKPRKKLGIKQVFVESLLILQF